MHNENILEMKKENYLKSSQFRRFKQNIRKLTKEEKKERELVSVEKNLTRLKFLPFNHKKKYRDRAQIRRIENPETSLPLQENFVADQHFIPFKIASNLSTPLSHENAGIF